MQSRLEKHYQKEVVPKLMSEFSYSNVHQVPRIQKVVLNVGAGRAVSDNKIMEIATITLRKITGQQPLETKAKGSIAGFKLREGQKIGLKVTLRRLYMWEFIDRLISIVLPRTRDFRGLSRKAFDRDGNYSVGIKDQSVFPELTYEDTSTIHGLQVNIVTNSNDKIANQRLLELLGMPLERTTQPTKKVTDKSVRPRASALNISGVEG